MGHLLDCLRGARRIGLFAALALLALAGLLLMNGGAGNGRMSATPEERRLAAILGEIDGVGDVHVMIAVNGDGTASGAVVVCSGLDGMRAYLEVQSAVQALLDVEVARIRVIGKDGFGGAVS